METWRPVLGYEGRYEVSDQGRVKSLAHIRVVRNGSGYVRKNYPAKLLSCFPNQGQRGRCGLVKPYLMVCLWKNGKSNQIFVHRLVAMAFIGVPRAKQPEVNHKDGNKLNNAVHNLEWCSRSENMRHAFVSGLNLPRDMRGERANFRKLSANNVLEIRRLISLGQTHAKIAEQFSVTRSNIGCIVRGKSWTSI